MIKIDVKLSKQIGRGGEIQEISCRNRNNKVEKINLGTE